MSASAHMLQNPTDHLSGKHHPYQHKKSLTYFAFTAITTSFLLHPFPVQAGAGMFKAQIVEDEIRRPVVGLTPDTEIKEEEGVIKTKCQGPFIRTKSQSPIRPRQQAAMDIEVSASPLRQECFDNQESVLKKINPGKDGRVRVDPTDQRPHSVHGAVVMCFPRMPDGIPYGLGTGALIAPNVVLTAAHNLYKANYGGRATSVRFLPAINRKMLSFDEPIVENFYYPEAHTKDKYSEDYGILILDRPLGEETGYLGLSVLPRQALKALTISISGYPKDKVAERDREYELWGMHGPVHNLNSNYIEYEHDTYGGQSGSPVCYQRGGSNYVVGIHVLEDPVRGVNKATLLTEARYIQINAWVQGPETTQMTSGQRSRIARQLWPHSVHGVVVTHFSPGNDPYMMSTGALIAPNVVLTCAHSLYNHREGRKASFVRFLPAVNHKTLPFGEPTVKNFYYPEAYVKDKLSKENYGILILDRPLGEETGYLGISVLPDQTLKNLKLSVTGYPADKGNGEYELWGMEGPVHSIDSDYISYEIETSAGQAGSSVCYKDGDDYRVVGIHVVKDLAQGVNKATRLTKARYDQINAWIANSKKSKP